MRLEAKCHLCYKVFEGAILKVRTLYKDIQDIKGDRGNLMHTYYKLGQFLQEAIDEHHRLLMHKYENSTPSPEGIKGEVR